MKKLIWLFMFFTLIISGCAIKGNVMRERGFGYLYEGVIVNPTQYTVTISNSNWKKDVTIPPESGKTIFLPEGRTYFLTTYYDNGEAIIRWEEWERITPVWRKCFFEDEFFYWQIVVQDPMTLPSHKNLLRK